MSQNLRALCATLLHAVLEQGQSLRERLPDTQQALSDKDKAWVQEMTYGVLRQLPQLQQWLRPRLSKPLKGKNKVFEHLLMLGLYQIAFTRVSAHAAVSETVAACHTLGNPGLKGLVNAILRGAQRDGLELSDDVRIQAGLPNWLFNSLQQSYPEHINDIVSAMNTRAPLWLRLNRTRCTEAQFQQALTNAGISFEQPDTHPDAFVLLQSADVTALPGFEDGWFAVQDGAAQLAAAYLNAEAGENVLDACAAPGGKTGHLLERQPRIARLTALDSDAKRLERVTQNLKRLGHQAEIVCADAADIDAWWDGQPFDRILLDAPCSATGVIRRHPDIRWLRKASDIEQLVVLQRRILQALWRTLKPGGHLLYATCSVFARENTDQIQHFLQSQSDAIHVPLHPVDTPQNPGRQILPGEQQMDGFYYAMLLKSE